MREKGPAPAGHSNLFLLPLYEDREKIIYRKICARVHKRLKVKRKREQNPVVKSQKILVTNDKQKLMSIICKELNSASD